MIFVTFRQACAKPAGRIRSGPCATQWGAGEELAPGDNSFAPMDCQSQPERARRPRTALLFGTAERIERANGANELTAAAHGRRSAVKSASTSGRYRVGNCYDLQQGCFGDLSAIKLGAICPSSTRQGRAQRLPPATGLWSYLPTVIGICGALPRRSTKSRRLRRSSSFTEMAATANRRCCGSSWRSAVNGSRRTTGAILRACQMRISSLSCATRMFHSSPPSCTTLA